MKYDYGCDKCGCVQEIYIDVSDIMEGQRKTVNLEKLTERINQERFCECGGKLKRSYPIIKDDQIIMFSGRASCRKQRFA